MVLSENQFFPLLKLAIPLALTGLVQSSAFFFETIFLSHLSQEALAAGALVSWLFWTLTVILFGTLGSINILIAHKFGANDHKGISLVVRDGLLLAIFFAVPVFLLSWNIAPIFLLLSQNPTTTALAQSYLHAMSWGILPDFVMIAFLELIMGIGHMRIIMIFSILYVPINIVFSYTLIFGKWGLPALGIAGAGWGMSISYWITAILLGIYIVTHEKYKDYFHNLFNFQKPSYLFELIKIGVPMGIMYSFEVAFFLVVTLLMGTFGSHILAANQIVMQYSGTILGVIFSIGQAVTVRIGHLSGANDTYSLAKAGYAGFYMVSIFTVIIAIFYWLFPIALISIDFDVHAANNQEVVYYAQQFFAIAAVFMILEAGRISFLSALRGLKDTYFPLLTSIISFWCIALPVGYYLATRLNFGGVGLWWGMAAGTVVSVVLLYYRFKFKIKHREGSP